MILNEGVDFVRVASDEDQKAFTRPPERILIDDRTRIYRWTDTLPEAGARVSPWWSFYETRTMSGGQVFDGFDVHKELATRLGKTHQEYARARLALSEKFRNRMSRVIVARSTVRMWAFWGTVAGQHEFKDPRLKHVFFIGGASQLYIPNLEYPGHFAIESDTQIDGAK